MTVLGSGVTAPNARRGEPGHHLLLDGASILLDGGSGTKHRMAQAGVDPFTLSHVFYTHLHTDHVSDMATLLFALRNTPDRQRESDLHLQGPVGFLDYYQTLRRLNGEGRWWDTPSYQPQPREQLAGRTDEPSFTISTLPVNHMEGRAVGYRIEDASGTVVAYSGDTDECDEIVELGRGADLLILECSFPDDQPRAGHLTPARCGRICRQAEPRALVLVHMYPPCDGHDVAAEVREVWDGPVTAAADFQRFSVSR